MSIYLKIKRYTAKHYERHCEVVKEISACIGGVLAVGCVCILTSAAII